MKNRVKELKLVAIDLLLDHPQNWRLHTFEQLQALEAAVNEIGITNPIRCVAVDIDQVTHYQIVDGHARKDILKSAGLMQVPVIVLDLTEDEVRIALATDDAIAMMAETDLQARALLAESIDTQVSDVLSLVITKGLTSEQTEMQMVMPTEETFNPVAIFVITFETTSQEKRDEVVKLLADNDIVATVSVKR